MTQESGGSTIAVARMNARAGTRRTRRRIGIGATLTVALGVAVLGFGAGGAGAAEKFEDTSVTLRVTTNKDVVPILPSTTEDVGTTSDGKVKFAALSACLAEITTSEDRTTLDSLNNQVSGAESAVNNSEATDLNVDEPCSLRMALTAAPLVATPASSLTGNATSGIGAATVKIEIAETLKGETFEIEANEVLSNANNGNSDSGLLSVTSIPLPPILGGQVELDGCGGVASTKPCVNLQFGGNVSLGTDTTKSVVEGLPGLIALADHTTIKGFAFQGGLGPAILAPLIPTKQSVVPGRLTVQNSWFGLKVNDSGERAKKSTGSSGFESVMAPRVGIQVSGNGTLNNKDTTIQGNVFADEESRMVGVLISGGSRTKVIDNSFGTNEAGRVNSGLGIGTGVRLTGLNPANVRQLVRTVNAATGQNLDEDTGSAETLPLATDNTISGNTFVNAVETGVDVGGQPASSSAGGLNRLAMSGVSETTIQSNRIGVDVVGTKGGSSNNKIAGILVRNGARDTTVGGETPDLGNVISLGNEISFNKGPGLLVAGTTETAFEDGAGLGTTFINNTGQGNGSPGLIQFGNSRVSGGIQPPVITSASPTSISGTAAPNSTVHVYRTHSDKQGEIAEPLGEAVTAGADGGWSAPVSVAGNSYVTATATIAAGTSELASNVKVPAPPPPKKGDDTPPPPPPADTDPPSLTLIAGQDPSKDGPVVLTSKTLKTLGGQVADESGVARVRVALQVLKVRKERLGKRSGHARAPLAERICRFVHLVKSGMIRRPCSRPPYRAARLREAQSGDTAWRVPISDKVRSRLRVGRYRLLIELTDANGLVTTERVPVVIKKKG